MNKLRYADERLSPRFDLTDSTGIVALSNQELQYFLELCTHIGTLNACQTGIINQHYYGEEAVVRTFKELFEDTFAQLASAISNLRLRTHFIPLTDAEAIRRQNNTIMEHASECIDKLQDMEPSSDRYLIAKLADVIQQHCTLHEVARRNLAKLPVGRASGE